MKLAIIGAAGKTGICTTRLALELGFEVAAVCREPSAARLIEYADHTGFELVTAPVVSDEAMLTEALEGCDAVVAILISASKLKSSSLTREDYAACMLDSLGNPEHHRRTLTVVGDGGRG